MTKPKPGPGLTPGEMKFYGLNACAALWHNRAIDIVRVYVTNERLKEFGPLLKWCASQKKAYHVLTPPEMERVAASVHHEGVVILARQPRRFGDDDFAQRLQAQAKSACLVYLDGVQNPHNVGSITRVAAHFGVPMILGKAGELPRLTPAAARIAEGAIEHVAYVDLDRPDAALAQLKSKGYSVVATSSHAEDSLYSGALPERSVVVFGGEVAGASAKLLKAADRVIRIPGTDAVESLNVAVAVGLVLGEHWRQHRVLRQ